MNNEKLRKKLAIFDQPGAYWVFADLLRLFDGQTGMITDDINDDFYLVYINTLKQQYERNLISNKDPIQMDIEDAIKEAKLDENIPNSKEGPEF